MKAPFTDELLFGNTDVDDQADAMLAAALGQSKTSNGDKTHKHRRTRSDVAASAKRSSPRKVLSDKGPVVEDLDKKPERDPLRFIDIMLTSLDMLGKLHDAVTIVKQRMPLELFKITERAITDLDARSPDLMHAVALEARLENRATYSRLTPQRGASSQRVLKDILVMLAKRFSWVLEMHRYTIQSFQRVLRVSENQTGDKKFIRYTLNDLWNGIQYEVPSLSAIPLIDDR
jgi:hypothetical protein